jgi:hypothetical protein
MARPLRVSYYYIGREKGPEWLKMDFILGIFGNKISDSKRNYKKFVEIMIDQEYESPLKDVVSSTLLGTKEFISNIKDRYLTGLKDDKDLPTLKTLKREISIETISDEVEKEIKDNMKLSRNLKIYLSQKFTGKRLDDIGKHFDIGGSGVCQAGRRIAIQTASDKALAKAVKRIKGNLSRMKV